jgi:hypothetical protein
MLAIKKKLLKHLQNPSVLGSISWFQNIFVRKSPFSRQKLVNIAKKSE